MLRKKKLIFKVENESQLSVSHFVDRYFLRVHVCNNFRIRTTSKLRPKNVVPKVVAFVRFHCIVIEEIKAKLVGGSQDILWVPTTIANSTLNVAMIVFHCQR